MIFHQLIFNIGQKLRNPSLRTVFKFLKTSEHDSLLKLKEYQLKRVKELVIFAYENSNYYRRKFDEVEFKPEDFNLLKDLEKLPILTKSDLLHFNQEIHTTDKVKFNKLFKASSSGTTGESLQFLRDENADSFNRASIFRGYSWYGVQPWDYNGYFWGFNFSKLQKLKTRISDFLVNRYRLFTYTEKDFLPFIKEIRNATYLEGYSSMIYQTAKLINQKNLEKPKHLKMVKGTSEKIYDSYQAEVQEAFGLKMISEYGAAETGIIAFECPKGKMHINMEGVIVEEINHEIVVTNLVMQSFPIIRYKLGDFIELAPENENCACGMQHPIINEVTGRIGELVYGNFEIYPSLYFYYIFKNLDKNHQIALTYQIIQNEKGVLLFHIAEKLNEQQKQVLRSETEKYFGKDMSCTIMDHQNLFMDRKGKLKSFISHVKQ
jgi:phenylacetate-CoA ligase